MDSISHSCFSYLVCRASGTAPNPRAGLLAAAVALLPDLDFLALPLLPETARFAFHRGPSHSLAASLAMGALIGFGASRFTGVSTLRAVGIAALAWFSHSVLDMCTGFGVALWWPLTHARTSFDLLFVVDPLATLPLLIAVGVDIARPRSAAGGLRGPAAAGLAVFTAYAVLALGIRRNLAGSFRKRLEEQGRVVEAVHAEPTPFNNQLWYLCAKTREGFAITYRGVWDGDQWERIAFLPRVQLPLRRFPGGELTNKMRTVLEDWFTCRRAAPDRLEVVDLRLGKRYGWEDENAPFLFIYRVWLAPDGSAEWSMTKPGSRYDYGRLTRLARRVAGHIPAGRISRNPPMEAVSP